VRQRVGDGAGAAVMDNGAATREYLVQRDEVNEPDIVRHAGQPGPLLGLERRYQLDVEFRD
jgi:hypothetical protein